MRNPSHLRITGVDGRGRWTPKAIKSRPIGLWIWSNPQADNN